VFARVVATVCTCPVEDPDARSLPARRRLCRRRPHGPLLGRGVGLRARAAAAGFATWDDFYRDLGVPEDELGGSADRISDPHGQGPSVWFQVVPEAKSVKNRLHVDIHASGARTDPLDDRRRRVDAEAARLVDLGATVTGVLSQEGLDHYAVAMSDPEGNEFDVN
jgi:hypothetical protein